MKFDTEPVAFSKAVMICALISLGALFGGCSSGLDPQRHEVTSTAAKNVSFTVSCGEGEVLLSGGCSCATGEGITSSVRSSGEGWSCACDQAPSSGTHKAVAICSAKSDLSRTEVTRTTTANQMATECSDPSTMARVGVGVLCVNESSIPQKIQSAYPTTGVTDCGYGDCKASSLSRTTSVQCITGMAAPGRAQETAATTGGTTTATARCDSGQVVVGGGCACDSGAQLLESLPSSDLLSYSCTCTDGLLDHTMSAIALCASPD